MSCNCSSIIVLWTKLASNTIVAIYLRQLLNWSLHSRIQYSRHSIISIWEDWHQTDWFGRNYRVVKLTRNVKCITTLDCFIAARRGTPKHNECHRRAPTPGNGMHFNCGSRHARECVPWEKLGLEPSRQHEEPHCSGRVMFAWLLDWRTTCLKVKSTSLVKGRETTLQILTFWLEPFLSPSTQADFLKNGEVIFTGDVTAGFVVSGTIY